MDKLTFDPDKYEVKTISFGGITVTYRAFEGISYCSAPKDPVQKLNIFVPEKYYSGETINGYDMNTVPILVPNAVNGYMEGPAQVPGERRFMGRASGRPNILLEALDHGYVVVSPGIRGRNSSGGDSAVGKAPALIVDMKAVIRYLRHNRDLIPGDTEKIFTNGTSAGGALSALAGATGNSPDYEPFLEEIGAAKERDDIFGASCFCPIINLENADKAYEWIFQGEYDYLAMRRVTDENGTRREAFAGHMTGQQIEASKELAAMFPGYVNSLELKDENGRDLTLDADGEGSFADYVGGKVFDSAVAELKYHKSAEKLSRLMAEGSRVEECDFLDIRDGKLFCLDWDGYVKAVQRLKTAPAFDSLDLSTAENEEFGNAAAPKRHFTEYSFRNSNVCGTMAEEQTIKMINPMKYVGEADTAPHWRIRYGTHDRGSSIAIPSIFAAMLLSKGYDTDFELQWGLPHCGDYDLENLFAWIDGLCGEK